MGCITSKHAAAALTPPRAATRPSSSDNEYGFVSLNSSLRKSSGFWDFDKKEEGRGENHSRELKKSRKKNSHERSAKSSIHGNRFGEAEQVAAGWPTWLSSAAPEAIHGWVPLRAESYEKLEKIGQGTYSSVFRARELETGRMVALKKVRFDNFQPESIRFMAREIMILRRLDHPNIMKLEGLVTSRLSCSIYLVFEYMEHDLAGLLSSPDIKFSDAQVKCYMKQILSGIEHCHLRGVMHRDIKTSNILVNNEGILKLADFGLAKTLNPRSRKVLTSRVVTLWYRPPELLMGSTNYGVSVDLWSVGCVFAELFFRKPVLKGRTEVEQLHKIFKLCGSPSEEFWKKSKLPHSTMFKPQHPYPRTLQEKFKDFPPNFVSLMETFLSIEPYKRGTASSALIADYFKTEPYPCAPSSLPKYPPNKEIDAKIREEARKKKVGIKLRESGAARKPRKVQSFMQETNDFSKLPTKEDLQNNTQFARKNETQIIGERSVMYRQTLKRPADAGSDFSLVTAVSKGIAAPVQFSARGDFGWARKTKKDASFTRSFSKMSSRSQLSALDSASLVFAKNSSDSANREDVHDQDKTCSNSRYDENHAASKYGEGKPQKQLGRAPTFHLADSCHFRAVSPQLSLDANQDQGACIDYSGPLLTRSSQIDEFLQQNDNANRNAVRRSKHKRENDG